MAKISGGSIKEVRKAPDNVWKVIDFVDIEIWRYKFNEYTYIYTYLYLDIYDYIDTIFYITHLHR